MHWTLGILPHFQAFFWLRVIPAPKQNPARPTTTNANRWAGKAHGGICGIYQVK
jgi:hypothetical protein